MINSYQMNEELINYQDNEENDIISRHSSSIAKMLHTFPDWSYHRIDTIHIRWLVGILAHLPLDRI